MFDALSKGFRAAKNRLSGVTELTEENIDAALRDVRLSLLEADVEFGVTKRFLAKVKEKAVGETVRTSADVKGKRVKIGPAEQFIKICQDELVALMESEGEAIEYAPKPAVTGIMMVGLQGAGKTTTAAKLARLCEKEGRRPLLVAADLQRPGAVEQLQVLGERIEVPVFAMPGATPFEVCHKAMGEARKLKCDTVIYDTAGRLAIDDELMKELADIKTRVRPQNVFLVVDAMIGQDAVQTAAAFHERLSISGAILTKLDGDARGGAALSVRQVTGAPIRFVGMGEGMDRLEAFRADGMASRILGFGDVVGLMNDFSEVVDEEKAERDAKRMLAGRFTFDDFLEQIGMLQQMGPLQDMMEKVPFFAESVPDGFQVDERELDRIKAIVNSMTKAERAEPELFAKSRGRVTRVAKGSGRTEQDVASLLQRFSFMQNMMGQIGKQAGLLGKLPGMKQLAMARQLKNAVSTGGFEGNPMIANLADTLLEAAVADGPGGGGGQRGNAPKRKQPSAAHRKAQRKKQRKARRKSRK
ncbi:MAG: signal recognition particle protein [Myxococcales bacterium]|nr:signal recognition particle protein [Myxococcales bacterium]MDD9968173.1 signal recognition particle protein [Myxococcales bacterium]